MSLDLSSFFRSSLASLRTFRIETLHFSPIDLISFFNSVLLSSLSSGTGNLYPIMDIGDKDYNQVLLLTKDYGLQV